MILVLSKDRGKTSQPRISAVTDGEYLSGERLMVNFSKSTGSVNVN